MNVLEREIEVGSGETLRIGEFFVTVLEIDGDAIHVRIDGDDDFPADLPSFGEDRFQLFDR